MNEPTEVVSVLRHDVRPGHELQYEAWTREVLPIARTFEGHHGVAIVRPPDGARTYTIVLHFDTLDHLRGWLESDVRQLLLARVQPHLLQPGEVACCEPASLPPGRTWGHKSRYRSCPPGRWAA